MKAASPLPRLVALLLLFLSGAAPTEQEILYPARGQWGRITDGGRFGDGAHHPAGANGFTTLRALQAAFPFATSLSDDMAGLAVQAAWLAAGRNGSGVVALPPGRFYAPERGLVQPSRSPARLEGSGKDTVVIAARACAAGNPAITLDDVGSGRLGGVSNLTVQGRAEVTRFETNKQPGQPIGPVSTTDGQEMFSPGCRGIRLRHSTYAAYDNLAFHNLDRPLDWDLDGPPEGGHNYITTFSRIESSFNNEGFPVRLFEGTTAASDSGERIVLRDSVLHNNNTNLLVQLGDGKKTSIIADVFVEGTALDYPAVNQVVNVGGVEGFVHQSQLFLTQNHMETNSDTMTGTAPRIENNGDILLRDNVVVELGAPPFSLIRPNSFNAAQTLAGTMQVPNRFPFVGDPGRGLYPNVVDGGGNRGGDLLVSREGNLATAWRYRTVLPFPYTLLDQDNHDGAHLTVLPGGGPITIPADATGPFVMTGTRLVFTCVPGIICQFIPAGGVTIASRGSGLTFGNTAGGKPAEAYLTKIGRNAWAATGDMN